MKRFDLNYIWPKCTFRKIFAFTLAEILIVIGIVGFVAEITIPTLIGNAQKTQHLTAFKSVYSIFNQALWKYANDQGCPGDLACTPLFAGRITTNGPEWDYFYSNYLKVSNNCQRIAPSDCFPPSEKTFNTNEYDTVYNGGSYYNVSLVNGASIGIYYTPTSSYCKGNSTYPANNALYGYCGAVILDTNGLKGPNQYGKDAFLMAISRYKGLTPNDGSQARAEASNDTTMSWRNAISYLYSCGSSVSSYGYACAARVIEENWQMNYY